MYMQNRVGSPWVGVDIREIVVEGFSMRTYWGRYTSNGKQICRGFPYTSDGLMKAKIFHHAGKAGLLP